MQLDLTLARLMLGVTGVAAALMLFVIASLKRSGLPGVRHWFLANVCATLGMMLLTARGHIPDLLSIPLANALMAAGAFLLVGGTRRFFGLAPIWRIGLASTTLFTALLCWFTWVQPSFDVRVALSSVLHAGATLWLTLTLYRGRRTVSSPYSGQYCVAVAGLETLLHLTRGALYLVSEHPHRAFESSILNLGWFAIGTLAMPALTMGLVMLAHDRLRSQLERQLNFDELTGAASRRAFLRQAQHELTQARRSGQALSIAMIDIDWFKRLNDALGHSGGDAVLGHFVAVVQAYLPPHHLIGRLGGEEFCVLMAHTDVAGACAWLARLRDRLHERALQIDQQWVRFTFSAGVAECTAAASLDEALKLADDRLYQAKARGRNMTC